MQTDALTQNQNSWNAMADDWFGVTALPTYGCLIPTETELQLFGEVYGKIILDIGCGSGHSLKYQGDNGAIELWGLDISSSQIKNAKRYLSECGYQANLFTSPMEVNPGLPEGYFDIVQSIYAVGWSMDLQKTFDLVASYLKQNGTFIFSWDHPFMHCVDVVGSQLVFSGSYFESDLFTFSKSGNEVSLFNRRMSDYINALAKAGFAIEALIEETDKETLERDAAYTSQYYAPCKAKQFPLSFIIKARKL